MQFHVWWDSPNADIPHWAYEKSGSGLREAGIVADYKVAFGQRVAGQGGQTASAHTSSVDGKTAGWQVNAVGESGSGWGGSDVEGVGLQSPSESARGGGAGNGQLIESCDVFGVAGYVSLKGGGEEISRIKVGNGQTGGGGVG